MVGDERSQEEAGEPDALSSVAMRKLEEKYSDRIEILVRKAMDKIRDESQKSELRIHETSTISQIQEVARRIGNPPEDVISLAMTLYETALDAHDRGERLVLLTGDYKFVREIIGLAPKAGAAEFEKAAR